MEQRQRARFHLKEGFTLLEMMLALVVFAVGTVAAVELMQRSQAGQSDGENTLIATGVAQQCMEELRSVSFGSLAAATCSAPSGYALFTPAVAVTSINANLSQVAVTVSWSAPGGTVNVALQSYRSAN